MRVRVIFQLKNRGAAVPFHHQHLISDIIDGLIKDAGYAPTDEHLYSFSGIKGQTKVGKGGLFFFSSRVTIVLSSPNEMFLKNILRSLFKKSSIIIGEMELIPELVEKEKDPDFKEEMKYVGLSPLVIMGYQYGDPESVVKQFIDPLMDQFSDVLYESTMARMEESKMFTSQEIEAFFKFQVVPDKEYIERIKKSNKKFSRVYPVTLNGYNKEIRGYTLPFTIFAHPTVQKFIFECGFGEYSTKGYGLLDIANSNPLERAEIFKLD